MVESRPSLLVAIPALNEAETITAVVDGVRRAVPHADVLVVDDGSSDDTAGVARGVGAVVVSLPFNVGVGGAMRTAFRYAVEREYDVVVQVDGDGQHDPAEIPRLLGGLDGASVVVGSRFHGGSDYRVRGPRRWAMRLLARAVSRVGGTRIDDTTSGFRAAGREAMTLFAARYPTEYLGDTVESLVIAARSGLRIAQVPVTMRPRAGGRASQGPVRSTLYLGRAGLALFVAVYGRPPTPAEETT